ncbi:MAG: primosomal protein N' [Lachnospiraceae bacterium]|nr:primosomal protein N' [Lachnospiraceae bacterium]
MNDLFAEIIVDISHENLDHTFSYRIPEELRSAVTVGSRVLIPFGKGNRQIAGFVLDVTDRASYDLSKTKDITAVTGDETLVEQKLIMLAYWMKERYGSTMNRALSTVLPVKKNVRSVVKRTVELAVGEDEAKELIAQFEKKRSVARQRLLTELLEQGSIDYKLVTGKLNISPATLRALCGMNIIRVVSERVYRNTVNAGGSGEKVSLTPAQQAVLDDFCDEYRRGHRGTYLLFGVTGSGKTEVYMEMIDKVISEGRQVIVLIPEISLTYQTVMRFYRRFGDRVSTLHSRLSDGERYDQFERARKHEIDIMIGPRSALFTPFDDIGLIVMDEEHEHTYKSDQIPRYHAREVAIKLAGLHGASVVLGSATPSVESYHAAVSGQYKLYKLSERAKSAALPEVSVVDMRQELKAGNKTMFSEALKRGIEERLQKGEQVMLFLNRRGISGSVSCRACGEPVKCPHCDVSLTRHGNGRLKCHYCGYEQSDVRTCGRCGSRLIGAMGVGVGTEAVAEQIKKMFPYASVLRMDADTTKQKGDYESILSTFANREADILVGTQMIVKGHDFPYVTLVGILAADMSLNANDYRAGERTFQLLVQAAGRAGRDRMAGNVIIQTYRPDNYAVSAALTQDYEAFYEEEMSFRTMLMYPPAGHMLAVLIESPDQDECIRMSDSLAGTIRNGIMGTAVLIGPTAASIGKLKDIYRRMIYVKSMDVDVLVAIKDEAEKFFDNSEAGRWRISFDLDPMNSY